MSREVVIIIAVALLLVLIAGFAVFAIYITKTFKQSGTGSGSSPSSISAKRGASETPLDVARMRYAKGDITREQFEQIKKDLS